MPGKFTPLVQISPLTRHISDKNDTAVNSIHKQDYFTKFIDFVRLSHKFPGGDGWQTACCHGHISIFQ